MSAKNWFLAVIIFLALMVGCDSPPDTARVTQVIDGDTIVVEGGYYVRYVGIDAPEVYPKPEPFGLEAWAANRKLVEGKKVRLERDVSRTDIYGRLLYYVYVDGIFVNAELVKEGLAEAKAYPPDTKYRSYLEQMETEARLAGRGMWAEQEGTPTGVPSQ